MNAHPAARITLRLARLRMPLILAALCLAATALTEGRFAQGDNLVNVLRQVSLEGLIALGMTLVIITGGIDLSVGSMTALCGVVAAIIMRETQSAGAAASMVMAAAGAIGVGAFCGAACGAIIAHGAIPAFIVTLSVMLIARGAAFILCNGQPVYELPAELVFWGRGFVWESVLGRALPVPVLMLGTAALVFYVLLDRTVFGRAVVAIGSNESAARFAAIPVRRTKIIVYTLTGLLCGLAGMLHDAKLMAGDPKVGEMWELNVIAAVVVGGTSLFGGRGSIGGTLVGALIIGVLNNSLNLMHVEHFWQKIVLGGVILAAGMLDAALRRLDAR